MNPPVSEAAVEARRGLPVFVSADGRRQRMLRVLGRVAAGLTVLWLVALLAGAIGLGRLPGVPLPEAGQTPADEDGTASPAPAAPAGGAAQRLNDTTGATDTVPRRSGHESGGRTPVPPRHGGPQRRTPAPPRSGGPGARVVPGTPGSPTAPFPTDPAPSVPGRSGTAPGAVHRPSDDRVGGGPPTAPGKGGADPPANGREHSPRWGDGSG
jgi:hypothetical protein